MVPPGTLHLPAEDVAREVHPLRIEAELEQIHAEDFDQLGLAGEADETKNAASQEGVGQLFFVIAGDDDDRRRLAPVVLPEHAPVFARLIGVELLDGELLLVKLVQQVVGKIDVSLVDLVDEHYRLALTAQRLAEWAERKIRREFLCPLAMQLCILQAANHVQGTKSVARSRGRSDVPAVEVLVGVEPEFVDDGGGERRLATARCALDEQRPVQGQRDIYRAGEFWARKVGKAQGDIAVRWEAIAFESAKGFGSFIMSAVRF
jgi:hypothetical protein